MEFGEPWAVSAAAKSIRSVIKRFAGNDHGYEMIFVQLGF